MSEILDYDVCNPDTTDGGDGNNNNKAGLVQVAIALLLALFIWFK